MAYLARLMTWQKDKSGKYVENWTAVSLDLNEYPEFKLESKQGRTKGWLEICPDGIQFWPPGGSREKKTITWERLTQLEDELDNK